MNDSIPSPPPSPLPPPSRGAPEPETTPNGLATRLLGRRPGIRRAILAVLDGMMLFIALGLAYQIGFDFQPERFAGEYHSQFLYVAPWLVVLRLILLERFGLYRGIARYTSLHDLLNMGLAGLGGTVLVALFNVLTNHIPRLGGYPLLLGAGHILRIPWSVVVLELLLSMLFVAGLRLAWRVASERLGGASGQRIRRVLIVGAGHCGEQVVHDLLRNHRDRFRPVAFVDPDPMWHGRRIHGIPVAGGLEDVARLTERYAVEMVVVALARPTPALLRDLVAHCRQARLEFKIVPDLDSVMGGRVEISQLRPVEIEDLLGRPPIQLDELGERSCLRGHRVMVSGAGGSIGSELCRQALAHRPSAIMLVGRGENSIYEVQAELTERTRKAGIPLVARIGDVRDRALMDALMGEFRPEVVLHAAAHKHVHFMEHQPAEAVKNNILGTWRLAEAARTAGVERFVMISTDKAVRPTSVMGASKRVAEMIVAALNGLGPTHFIAVRFGNVLGSRGSVIPLFRRQIAAGGPVTVTDPEVKRFFMTIPEAVSLVLEAGSHGSGGELFVLDMGEPVRIADLARNLITLSGLEPERDIAIEYVGLRPGEKMDEALFTGDEKRLETEHPKIFRLAQPPLGWDALAPRIERFERLADDGDDTAIRQLLAELIPDYQGTRHKA